MRRQTLIAAALLLASVASAQEMQIRQGPPGPPSPGQARDTAKPKEGTGVIRGRVYAADTQGPLRRARVRLSSPELQINRSATTDLEGKFEFKKLPAARYNMSASKGSYVALDFGQRRPFERGRPVDLANGQVLEQVDFTLPRGCVITGRVVDDLGDPVADVNVTALRRQFAEGRRKPVAFGRSATTNDAGVYRLYGLPPGDYYIGTLFSPGGGGGGPMGADNEEGFVYAPTYYPGTASVGDAVRLSVKVGQERGGIDFTLVSSRTASISGSAFNSRGLPALGASIALGQTFTSVGGGMTMRMMSGVGAGSTSVQPDGSFRITGVAPGEYDITLSVPNPETGEEEAASANVSVNGVDVTGVNLVVVAGARVTGTIVADGGGPLPFPARGVRLSTAYPPGVVVPFRIRSAGGATIREDWSFELKGLDGPRTFRVTGLPAGWMVKSARLDGRDITDSGMDFRGTEDVSGIQVVLTNRITTVAGSVTNDNGEPLKEYSLVVFADDPSKWSPQSRYIAATRPDQNGQFKIEQLPAGNYLAIALDYLEEGDSSDPDFLGRVRDSATKFGLADGETKSLSMKLAKLDR
jgi:hypothetical protein